MAIDFTTPLGRVRLLANDVDIDNEVFSDVEIDAFLLLEGGNEKLAAAQAIDTIADNEALTSKVLKSQDVQTDGAKLADSLRKRAEALRQQHDADVDGVGAFEIIDVASSRPEHTNYPTGWL